MNKFLGNSIFNFIRTKMTNKYLISW
uniref:Uncharacterized protein n=1 Tax=Anguilla anguilla TaxID=7936 RepID=A0A0E9RQT5_ANGAN